MTPSHDSSCTYCDARLLPVRGDAGVQWVCARCPLPPSTHPETLAARWRAWLGDHGVTIAQPPITSPALWWVPAARTLLLVAAVPHPTVVEAAMRRGIEHGWDVVWLGRTPGDMNVLVDSHVDEDIAPARAPRNLTPRLDDPAMAGRCSACGVFQWHTQWGWWVCRACRYADGDMTLEFDSMHGRGFTDAGGLPRCTTCLEAWGYTTAR